MEKIVNIVNLTPHPVGLYSNGSKVEEFPSNGSIRLEESDSKYSYFVFDYGSLPVCERTYGSSSLPEEKEGVILIVSNLVCAAFPSRRDLYYPAGDVRDMEGNIIGCTKLCQVPAQ